MLHEGVDVAIEDKMNREGKRSLVASIMGRDYNKKDTRKEVRSVKKTM